MKQILLLLIVLSPIFQIQSSSSIDTLSEAISSPFLNPLWKNNDFCPDEKGSTSCIDGYEIGNNHGAIWIFSNGTLILRNQTKIITSIQFKAIIFVQATIRTVNETDRKSVIIHYSTLSAETIFNFTSTSNTRGVKLTIEFRLSITLSILSFDIEVKTRTAPSIENDRARFQNWEWDYSDMTGISFFVTIRLFDGQTWKQTFSKTNVSGTLIVDPQITTSTSPGATLQSHQQRIFRNPRGQQRYYAFYRDDIGTGDKCFYAHSFDGTTWSSDIDAGMTSFYCSVVFREDAGNSRLIVYIGSSKTPLGIGTGKDIHFRIFEITDASSTLSALTANQIVRASASNENQGFATINLANDGFLHITFSYTVNAGGSANDKQNVVVCSSQTANPITNPTWNCTTPTGSNPFTPTNIANTGFLGFIPHITITDGVDEDTIILRGSCGPTEVYACSEYTDTDGSRVLSWNGASQSWGNSATFNYGATSGDNRNAGLRTAIVKKDSGRLLYVFEENNVNRNMYVRTIDPTYTTWSSRTVIDAGDKLGMHLTITEVGNPKIWIFYVEGSTNVFVRSSTDGISWTDEEIIDSSSGQAKYINSPWYQNNNLFPLVPVIWINDSTPDAVLFTTFDTSAIIPPVIEEDIDYLIMFMLTIAGFIIFQRKSKSKKEGKFQ